MKSGDTYRFTLAWPMDTEERILAGELLEKLGNKKSKFVVQLICDYITAHPEIINPKETLKFIINSTPLSDMLTEKIQSMIQTELAGKITIQQFPNTSDLEQTVPNTDESINDMFGNLDMWNNK